MFTLTLNRPAFLGGLWAYPTSITLCGMTAAQLQIPIAFAHETLTRESSAVSTIEACATPTIRQGAIVAGKSFPAGIPQPYTIAVIYGDRCEDCFWPMLALTCFARPVPAIERTLQAVLAI